MQNKGITTIERDAEQKIPYLYTKSGHWYGFEDPESLDNKVIILQGIRS